MAKNDTLRKIGINIAVARKAKGFTQKELASKINISRTQLTNIEGGNNGTSIDKLIKIAEILEVDVSKLLNVEITRCPTCGQFIE